MLDPKRDRKDWASESGECVGSGGQETEKTKPSLSPWKHRALSYSEGVECHVDCSCGLMNVGIHSSIHSFLSERSLSTHHWLGTILGAWDTSVDDTKVLVLIELTF